MRREAHDIRLLEIVAPEIVANWKPSVARQAEHLYKKGANKCREAYTGRMQAKILREEELAPKMSKNVVVDPYELTGKTASVS